jgi:hypothetical protein
MSATGRRPTSGALRNGRTGGRSLRVLESRWFKRALSAGDVAARPADAHAAIDRLEPLLAMNPWSERDARAALGQDAGFASTLLLRAGMVVNRAGSE